MWDFLEHCGREEHSLKGQKALTTRQIKIGSVQVGGPEFAVIAGPCSIESKEQFLESAQMVSRGGANLLRGGIFKMRTHPESFQGLGREALPFIKEVKEQVGMNLVSEITDPRQVEFLSEVVDVFQVGSRNMYNYSLLKELGELRKPILLKRGFSALIDEWLFAAQYILDRGNPNIILCERGVRTFETKTRNTLDLSAVAYIKANSDFPVIVDPSHGVGIPSLITPLSRAAIAVGADGLMIEVHPNPKKALSDGFQALDGHHFQMLMEDIERTARAFGRSVNERIEYRPIAASEQPPQATL